MLILPFPQLHPPHPPDLSAASSRVNDFQICKGEPITHTLSWVIYESNCALSGLRGPEIDVVGRGSGSQPQTVIFIETGHQRTEPAQMNDLEGLPWDYKAILSLAPTPKKRTEICLGIGRIVGDPGQVT